MVWIEDNVGNAISYTLDKAGNRLAEEIYDADDVLRYSLSRVYNQLGQMKSLFSADGDETRFDYDIHGNLEDSTDSLGRVTERRYDPLHRLVSDLRDVDGVSARATFEYDAFDRITRVTDPAMLDTVYGYSAFSDVLQLGSPDTGATNHGYDAAGNLTSRVDARGQAATYGYDALGRRLWIDYAGAAEQNVAYTYDTV